jgi:hypothetical protein
MLFIKRSFDKLLVVLAVAVVFCLLSYRPRSHISAQMPPEFLDASTVASTRQRVAEERLAKAYWDCVVNNIQWKYSYGSRLPQDPPPEFILTRADFVAGSEPSTRARYWRKLQQLWYMPNTWKKQYEWDTTWTISWMDQVKSVGSWLYSRLSAIRL